MAKFLNTTGVSYHLEELIKGTKDRLILISPYLQFNERIKEHINNLNIQKRDIRIVYRENKLHHDENNWLDKQIGVRTSICKNLHSKCYLNESEAIITSMNLYEFSQQNNNEMGIYITKSQDTDLYNATLDEVQRLLTISEEIRVTVQKVVQKDYGQTNKIKETKEHGHCIHCNKDISLNPLVPYCKDCYNVWKIYNNVDYQEQFCHICGIGEKTTIIKPTCYDCYKTNRNRLKFPTMTM
jgi:phosphatidylserine/phosphatidylglycerophosphate/cardiolipin synthase-like enzyme